MRSRSFLRLVQGPQVADSVLADAQDWILRIVEDPDAETPCALWRAADPAHQKAWDEANHVWAQSTALGSLAREDWRAEIAALSAKPSSARPALWGMAIAASLVAMIGVTTLIDRPDAQFRTAIAQTRDVALNDGSHVTLGAKSDLEIRFANDERRVVLNEGQAFFEVAHDAKRGFTVVAGDAEIHVTGTKFDVRRSAGEVHVSVLEGRVEVERHRLLPWLASARPDIVLTAGLTARLRAGARGFSAPGRDPAIAGEWRNGRFFYNEAPLGEIVSDIQRYSRVPIRIDDPTIANLRVTTSFHVNQIGPFLDNLSATLPLRQQRRQDGSIALEAQSTTD